MNYGYVKSKLNGTEPEFSEVPGLKVPEEYSYIPYLPKIINQGQKPICVPCSLSAHINWNKNVDDGDNKRDNKIDLLQIYKQKTSKGDGMSFKEALHFLKNKGVSSDKGVLKIRKYAIIGSELALKQAILLNGPCVAGLPVYNSNSCQFWENDRRFDFLGGHAICIVGWNKDGFLIRNSWGENFCSKGYTLLPYDDFSSFMEIWTIID